MSGTQIRLGKAMKEARKRLGMKQVEMAEKLGISLRHLQNLESEERTPSYAMLEHILEELDIPASYVFDRDSDEMSADNEKLKYLISNKCSESDIKILLATAEALVYKNNT